MGSFHLINALYAALAALLLSACVTDWRARIIPHRLNISIALLGVSSWAAQGWSFWPQMMMQLGLCLGILIIFSAVQVMGMMGGGDVKMLGALGLWFPLPLMLRLLVLMSIAGGLLTAAMLLSHKLQKREGRPEIPYGIAIAFAGIFILCEPYFNHSGPIGHY